jgi:acetoin utilization deacetylase AcuC-like enzyme
MESMKTGICTDPLFLEHDTGLGHPESKKRLISILDFLESKSYFKKLPLFSPIPASGEDLERVHSSNHIKTILSLKGKKGYLDIDTPYSEGTSEAAILSAGSGLVLADRMIDGSIQNGMAIVRPPGHHAKKNVAMGFCLLNNIAVTARYLQAKGFPKIAIVDWDVHHGNGTEDIFYEDDSVFFISSHQYPFYPGTGSEKDRGVGRGEGYNLNLPLQRGSGDETYVSLFKEKVKAELEKFQPNFILLSAGFDAHKKDPLAGMELSTHGFEKLTHLLKKSSEDLCQGRLISFLEGGYDLKALAESVEVHVAALNG